MRGIPRLSCLLLPPFHPADAELFALGKSPQLPGCPSSPYLLLGAQEPSFACQFGCILDDTGLFGLCFNRQKRSSERNDMLRAEDVSF